MRHYLFFYLKLPLMIRILIIIVLFMISFGIIIHFIEPKTFPSIFEGIYWAVITAATVGYGDYAPTTTIGRWMAILLVLSGGAFIVFFFGHVASVTFKKQNEWKEGKVMFTKKDHLIVVGYNERSKTTIMKLVNEQPSLPIVLVDFSLNENPLPDRKIHFIKGNATHDSVLEKANVKHAKMILITADENLKEADADMHTVLSILIAKGLNPNIYAVAEILTEEQKMNCIRAGVDKMIETTRLASKTMVDILKGHI
ncbi:potassium channel family protein [Fictibacillus gelatini]|uniref:potassium channel family protein n=1 Tax=Fictibacillus gelatini TaxID=225985 RepID=UPI0004027ABF|nr:potassium channel family protein [Fictibacillus gelatini]